MFGKGFKEDFGGHHGHHGHGPWKHIGRHFLEKAMSRGGHHGWGWNDNDYKEVFNHTNIKYFVLYLINHKPAYGYEIIKTIEDKFEGVYSPSPELIYPTLTNLEDLGFIQSKMEDNGKKVYSVTEEGKAYLENNQAKIDEILQMVEDAKNTVDKEMVKKVFVAIKKISLTIIERYREQNWTAPQIKQLLELLNNVVIEIKKI